MDIKDCGISHPVIVRGYPLGGNIGVITSVNYVLGRALVQLTNTANGAVTSTWFLPSFLDLLNPTPVPSQRWLYSPNGLSYYAPNTQPTKMVTYRELAAYRFNAQNPPHPDLDSELDAVWARKNPQAPQATGGITGAALSLGFFFGNPTSDFYVGPSPTGTHTCTDNRIDVGFTHHKFVCKICDKDLA